MFVRILQTRFTSCLFNQVHVRTSHKMVVQEVRHLKKGEEQPPLQAGLPRLYSMRFCPYAQRAHLMLDAKKVKYETINVNLEFKPDFIFEKSQGGKVPALEYDDGRLLSESLIISDYIDEAYPEPALHSKDPYVKALDKLFLEQVSDRLPATLFKILFGETAVELIMEFNDKLGLLEKELQTRGTKFLSGDVRPGWIDLMTWPWLERIELVEKHGKIDWSNLKVLKEYITRMQNDEGVKVSALTGDVHQRYLDMRKEGNVNYDFLL